MVLLITVKTGGCPMIEIKNLSKKYGNHIAVKNIDFVVNDGEILGLLGLNGAGKSTIMNIITGYLSMTTGSVEINGYDILLNPAEAKKHIGYLPELPPLYPDMTVKEYLYFMYDLKKVRLPKAPHIEEICKLVKIDNVYNRLIKNLSKGYRQRVGIAQTLLGNPDVIILDEPTVGLDPKQIIEVRNLIHHLGKNHTVIVSSHILSEIQSVCDRIIVINGGSIIADGKPNELSKMIAGGGNLTLRIKGEDNALRVSCMKLISSIKGVLDVSSIGSFEDGTTDFSIDFDVDADVRAEIISRLTEQKYVVLSLKEAEFDLEQIFLRLTNKNNKEKEE